MSTISPFSVNVMIVDDDSFMLEFVTGLLQDLGVRNIACAKDGKQALSAYDLARVKPNLILCDLHMPGTDGFQLMEQLGQRNCVAGIALMSGQEDRVVHSASLMANFHKLKVLGSLGKPVTSEALVKLIAKMS